MQLGLLVSGKVSEIGPCACLVNYTARYGRVGGVMSVGMCCMDSLEQLVRRKTHIKGPVTLSGHFFRGKVGSTGSCHRNTVHLCYKGITITRNCPAGQQATSVVFFQRLATQNEKITNLQKSMF